MRFLIWSFEHDAWWAPNRCGYTTDISKAGRYSKEDAGDIVTSSVWCEEIAILEAVVDELGAPTKDPFEGAR